MLKQPKKIGFFDGLCQNTQKNRKKRKTELKHCLFRDASVNWKPAQTGRHSRAQGEAIAQPWESAIRICIMIATALTAFR